MPAWIWFLIAVVAAVGGAALLLAERRRSSSHTRDRQRWAEQKSWEFVEADPVLPSRWRYGSIAQGGPGRALDLATGAVPGPGGRRLAHIFDHEQAGQVTGIIAAVRGVSPLPVAVELRLPSAPLPDDAGLDSLGQVGDRYAFVTNVAVARPLVTDEVARAADQVGDDVSLIWAEESWVLATISPDATPERTQELLQALVDVSAALEEANDSVPDGGTGADDGWDPDHPDHAGQAGGTDAGTDAGIDDAEITDDGDTTSWRRQGDRSDPGRASSMPRQTHRDRPGDIPYDIEDDETGPGSSGARSSSSSGR